MKKRKIKFFVLMFFLTSCLFFLSSSVLAQDNSGESKASANANKSTASNASSFDYTKEPTFKGLVPCATDENSTPCTLCHLIVGIQRIFKYGLYLVTTLAFVGLFIGGAIYMLSSGNETMMNAAKGALKNVLIGFALTVGAWLVVNIILNVLPLQSGMGVNKTKWYAFSCDTTSLQSSKKTSEENVKTTVSNANTSSKDEKGQVTDSCGKDSKGSCLNNTVGGECPVDLGWIAYEGKCSSKGLSKGNYVCCIKSN